MATNSTPSISLSTEARAVIWRIFGAGGSPLNSSSTYELIEPVIRKRAPSTDLDSAIREIRGWFDSHGDRRWLKSEMSEPVATLILEGIRNERGETAVWAAGSIDADLSARILLSCWSTQEIDSFVKVTISTLEKVCARDQVIDATRCPTLGAQDSLRAAIPKNAVVREGRLETFRHLDIHGFELVHHGLHPAVGNLLQLVVDLRPERFHSMIQRLDHPVVRTRAAHHKVGAERPRDHRKTLEWITEDSCDALVALAIVNTLNTVNGLDDEIKSTDHRDVDSYIWSTELRPPQDDLDTAAGDLLCGLVARLSLLKSLACTRWIGELLSGAPYILSTQDDRKMPRRIEQLERACSELLTRLVCHFWSDDLLDELRSGLCLTPRTTWTRHMADLAWEIRDTEPARSAEIARAILDEHEQQVAMELRRNHMFLDWSGYHDREWIRGLGATLALAEEKLDLLDWVSVRCRALPLSVWDAEENYEAFVTADRVVQHWFLVGLHAIGPLTELGRACDSQSVRVLAESLWAHCHFVGQYVHSHPGNSVVSEYAARLATEAAAPGDAWLLDLACSPGVGPRALWALIDQRKLKSARIGEVDTPYEDIIPEKLIRVASERFRKDTLQNLETLRYWAHLWVLLEVTDEAEKTVVALLAFPMRAHDRADKILALKLLALVASKRRLASEIAHYPASLYSQLWPGYTPSNEQPDRQYIDKCLERSPYRII